MRIAIIHNRYQDPGGEDTVFEQESEWLSRTETVLKITCRNHKGWQGLIQFALYPWNLFAARRILKKLIPFKPDVVHIHNLHYAIGPLLIRLLHRHGIPMVMTLHNYRLLCPSATLFHQNRIFRDSLYQDFPWKAVRLGVYSRSPLKTFWLALTYFLHKKAGTWDMIDRYFVLSEFARQLFVRYLPSVSDVKFSLKPNFVPDFSQDQTSVGDRQAMEDPAGNPLKRQEHFLFVGRLSIEKGILVLLDTFVHNGRQLRIAGDGSLRKEVEQAARIHPNIVYLGPLSRESVREELLACTALVFPSLWYEGMPMTLIEAFAAGTPVIASKLGSMESMVVPDTNGYLFDAGDSEQLENSLRQWAGLSVDQHQAISHQTRQLYLQLYGPEANTALMLQQYRDILS